MGSAPLEANATTTTATATARGGRRLRPALLLALAVAALFNVAGLRRELPFYYDADERLFVWMAVRMAAFRDPDPHWFGQPGSTVLYPLAALYRFDSLLFHGGPLARVDWGMLDRFRTDPGEFYLIGRALSVACWLSSLVLLWLLGRRVFSERAAVAAVWLAALSPLVMGHVQVVRTDAAGVLFGLLALWLSLRLVEAGNVRNQAAAGGAVGLAVASRYFMVTLLAPLLFVDLWRLRRSPAGSRRPERRQAALGLAAVPLAFVLSTPFLLLDAGTAVRNLRAEARTSHPGADGLSPPENLVFYAREVIPRELGLPAAVLAVAGVVWSLAFGPAAARALAVFVLAFLAGISVSSLHWARWAIPLVPLLALFAAATLEAMVVRWVARPALVRPSFVVGLLLLSVIPGRAMAFFALRQWRPTTRLLARGWLVEHLPPGARLLAERGSVPLVARQTVLEEHVAESPTGVDEEVVLGGRRIGLRLLPALGPGGTLDEYARQGFTHVAVASFTYRRYLDAPGEFPREAAFYRELFDHGRLLARFDPSTTRDGPVVQIFALPPAP